jgi:hypothetical protein
MAREAIQGGADTADVRDADRLLRELA